MSESDAEAFLLISHSSLCVFYAHTKMNFENRNNISKHKKIYNFTKFYLDPKNYCAREKHESLNKIQIIEKTLISCSQADTDNFFFENEV